MGKVKKIVEIEIDEGLHPAKSSKDSEMITSLLMDKDNNLVTNAPLRELDDYELRQRYAEPRVDSTLTSDQDYEWLRAIAEGAFSAVIERVGPWISKKIRENALPKIKSSANSVWAKAKNLSSRRTKAASILERKHTASVVKTAENDMSLKLAREIDNTGKSYRENMSSEEARRTYLEMVVLGAMLINRANRLRDARIEGEGDCARIPDAQDIIRVLNRPETVQALNAALDSDAMLLASEKLASLEELLGRDLYTASGAYLPISTNEMKKGLEGGAQNEVGISS